MQVTKIGSSSVRVEKVDAPQKTAAGKFLRALQDLDRGEQFMDRIVSRAMRGGDFNPQELIAIQAGVYRYTQKLELFGRLIDRAASSVRQVLTPQ
jgi:hypothetical protein